MEDTLNQRTQPSSPSHEPENSSNPILVLLLVAVIIGMGIYGYTKGNFEGVTKEELNEKYTLNSDISFDSIGIAEQNKYISKDEHKKEINKLKNKEPRVVEKVVEKVVYKDKIKEKIVQGKSTEVKVEKIVYKDKIIKQNPKVVEKLVERTIYKDRTIDKSKFNFFSCYGMKPSGYTLDKKCANGLKKFLKKNSDAKYFEVIAVMNPKDFRTIKILEQKIDLLNQIDLNKRQVSKLKELSSVGLDKLRVVETIWQVKKILGRDTIVVPVSYNVKSSIHRGTVLRAYK
jgi:predicted RND superfamily exporter protein